MSGHLTREEKDRWKDEVTLSRVADAELLGKWLIENKIDHKKDPNGNYKVAGMDISNTLKVKFWGGPCKSYQYNLEGIKQRIFNPNNL